MLLFLLVVEIMAIHIQNNENIKGIKDHKSESVVITQLADDTTLLLEDENSLQEGLSFIKMFGRSSGLIPNNEKSEAFWIGIKVESKEKPLDRT